jgi:hypothetical protein
MAAEQLDVEPRIKALAAALDGALRGGRHRPTPEEARQRGRAGALRRWAPILFEKLHPSNVVNALADATLKADSDGAMAASLAWEQLRDLTGMNDDDLGEVLFGLITTGKVCCITGDAGRRYFLPARVRDKLRRKRATEELRKRAA